MFTHLNPIRKLLSNGVKKFHLPEFFREKIRRAKGSLRDPFCCLGITSAFLFSILVISSLFFGAASGQPFSTILLLTEFPGNHTNTFLDPARRSGIESPDFLLVQRSSLKANTPPVLVSSQVLGALADGYEKEDVQKIIVEYIVEPGDILSTIAERLNVSLNTVLWANELKEKSIIQPGQKLIIPPVSGTIHHVKSGDTISEIARTYKAKIDEIIAFNELANENDIYIGDIIIVPGGVMPPPPAQPRAPAQVPLASTQFIAPVIPSYIITQGLHWYNAIDFSHEGYACGKPVIAVAGGTVQRTGYDRRAGNYVRILHPNGVVTFYGHLSVILVAPGQPVSQGTRIGLIGNTGYTIGQTGCHVHFEVRGAQNPFAR